MSGLSTRSRLGRQVTIASTGALLFTPLLALSAAHASTTQTLAYSSSASSPSRTIIITGYAMCASKVGPLPGLPAPCESVTLNSDYGPGLHQTVQPTTSNILDPNRGRFTFSDVPVPAVTDLNVMHYTVTAENGSGLTD